MEFYFAQFFNRLGSIIQVKNANTVQLKELWCLWLKRASRAVLVWFIRHAIFLSFRRVYIWSGGESIDESGASRVATAAGVWGCDNEVWGLKGAGA